jgi:hypothetical protein
MKVTMRLVVMTAVFRANREILPTVIGNNTMG